MLAFIVDLIEIFYFRSPLKGHMEAVRDALVSVKRVFADLVTAKRSM